MNGKFKLFDIGADYKMVSGGKIEWLPRVELIFVNEDEPGFTPVFRMQTDRICDNRLEALYLARTWAERTFDENCVVQFDADGSAAFSFSNE